MLLVIMVLMVVDLILGIHVCYIISSLLNLVTWILVSSVCDASRSMSREAMSAIRSWTRVFKWDAQLVVSLVVRYGSIMVRAGTTRARAHVPGARDVMSFELGGKRSGWTKNRTLHSGIRRRSHQLHQQQPEFIFPLLFCAHDTKFNHIVWLYCVLSAPQ